MEKEINQWQRLDALSSNGHPEDDFGIEMRENVRLSASNTTGDSSTSRKYSFFIFTNPVSGGYRASALTKLDVEKMIFSTFKPNGANVEVSFFSIIDDENRNAGLQTLKQLQHDDSLDLRAIVGGGDGTVMWLIQEMAAAGISFRRCPVGCIPFGTGNDLARCLGWGGEEPSVLIGTHLNGLKGLIRKWVDASIQDLDIWNVTIETYEDGGFKRVHKSILNKVEERFLLEKDPETGIERKAIKFAKKMCNYYSFGSDAMAGYGFDKSRTASRLCNKAIYAWEGFKGIFFGSLKIKSLLHRVEECKEVDLENHELKTDDNTPPPQDRSIDKIEYSGREFLLYPSGMIEDTPKHATIIKGNPSVFLCLNVPSYMGGAENPWGKAKGNVGVTDAANKTLPDFPEQNFGDGKLEILSFDGPLSLGLERMIPGQGKRVGQTEGPFALNFKRSDHLGKSLKTYMNIDGEYFQVIAPKSVRITRARDIPGGKVKVLVRNDR